MEDLLVTKFRKRRKVMKIKFVVPTQLSGKVIKIFEEPYIEYCGVYERVKKFLISQVEFQLKNSIGRQEVYRKSP
jgi:hypothetical protein